MALSNIITAVVTDLQVDYPALVSRVGARWVSSAKDPPPRIVWVPKSDSFGAPENINENPRQLLSCFTRLEVHVWGPGDAENTFAPTEALKNALLACLYRVCHGYLELLSGKWESEDGRLSDRGGLYLLELSLGIPITDRALGEADVDEIDQTEDLNP